MNNIPNFPAYMLNHHRLTDSDTSWLRTYLDLATPSLGEAIIGVNSLDLRTVLWMSKYQQAGIFAALVLDYPELRPAFSEWLRTKTFDQMFYDDVVPLLRHHLIIQAAMELEETDDPDWHIIRKGSDVYNAMVSATRSKLIAWKKFQQTVDKLIEK